MYMPWQSGQSRSRRQWRSMPAAAVPLSNTTLNGWTRLGRGRPSRTHLSRITTGFTFKWLVKMFKNRSVSLTSAAALTRPDSSKDLALYKPFTYLLTYDDILLSTLFIRHFLVDSCKNCLGSVDNWCRWRSSCFLLWFFSYNVWKDKLVETEAYGRIGSFKSARHQLGSKLKFTVPNLTTGVEKLHLCSCARWPSLRKRTES